MPTHSLARDRRTALYLQSPQLFLQMLTLELTLLEHNARRLGLIPAARLNGSSDLAWELLHSDILRRFPKIRFFDYTKIPARMNRFLEGADWPAGYHLTFSAQRRPQAIPQTRFPWQPEPVDRCTVRQATASRCGRRIGTRVFSGYTTII